MCSTCSLRSGFSHFMNMDSLSFTWYFVAAEPRISKQSGVQNVQQDSELCRCLDLKTFDDLSESKCSRNRVENVGWFHQHNKHYNLHTRIYKPHVCEAPQGQRLSHSKDS